MPPRHVFWLGLASAAGELIITDDMGRRAGFDPVTQERLEEIPDVSYSALWPNDPDHAHLPNPPPLSRAAAAKIAEIDGEPGATFTFEILGTDFGQAQLLIQEVGGTELPRILDVRTISLAPGSIETFIFTVPCRCRGDIDGDGERNGNDITGYIDCLLVGGANCGCADQDGNGVLTATDTALFVDVLLSGSGCG